MFSKQNRLAKTFAIATLVTAVTAGTAMAAPNKKFKQRFGNYEVDVDIDAQVRDGRGPALLNVRYSVEVEGRGAALQPLQLTLTVQNNEFHRGNIRAFNGRLGGNGFGLIHRGHARQQAPFQIVIPLTNPTDFKRGEVEFEGSITVQLPNWLERHSDHLIIDAKVVNQRTGRVLETERDLVDSDNRFDRRPPIAPRRPGRRF